MDVNLKNIGDRIKYIRELNCLNQHEFANKLLVSQQNISRYEKGQLDISTSFANKVKSVFGVNIDWLLSGYGEIKSENEYTKKSLNNIKPKFSKIRYFLLSRCINKGAVENEIKNSELGALESLVLQLLFKESFTWLRFIEYSDLLPSFKKDDETYRIIYDFMNNDKYAMDKITSYFQYCSKHRNKYNKKDVRKRIELITKQTAYGYHFYNLHNISNNQIEAFQDLIIPLLDSFIDEWGYYIKTFKFEKKRIIQEIDLLDNFRKIDIYLKLNDLIEDNNIELKQFRHDLDLTLNADFV